MAASQKIGLCTGAGGAVAEPRCCDHLVAALERAGVDTVYGVPGGAISPIYDALNDHPRIRMVHVRHETSALFMAIGHTRLRPESLPCVLVTSGPGVTNAMTGMAAARAEGAAALVIGGEVPRSKFGRNALQEGSTETIDVVGMARTVVQSAGLVGIPGRAVFQLRAAVEATREGRGGPAFLSLPLDVAVARVPTVHLGPSPARPRTPDPSAIAAAAAALRAAENPLILVGPGARAASAAVREMAERLRIPVITSPQAKGIVPETAAYCLGVFGYGGHSTAAERLEKSPPDVVLALGCSFCEPSTNSWSPLLQARSTMIQVDDGASEFGRNYRADIPIQGACADVVRALCTLLWDCPPWRVELSGIRHLPIAPAESSARLAPARVLEVLQRECPDDTVYTADIGEHLLYAIHHLRVTRPDQFIASLGLGSMGSGIGAAIGAKLAAPKRRVVSVCGDYGFQMYGMELATCVQERLGVVFLIMNDHRMRMVESGIQRIYGRTACMHGPPVDFAALARAHGAAGFVVHTLAELRHALSDVPDDRPTVIDARIDPGAAFPVNSRVKEISNFASS